ncbi:hypothetical protein STSP2_02203 [Anaerohalosphaera lusitana]|uniref:Uncharacterized protein n=1 Tax=Anaerohalosphaera lusitana TaxID=1936003 RepID=A0A1U9NMR0_9BACT|nr:hypothetical protein [Anaerohalosphaera lusitana]AQT69024.1 hypothetical protein STSP2_02203 [Anaerohalosphaera lusitana]
MSNSHKLSLIIFAVVTLTLPAWGEDGPRVDRPERDWRAGERGPGDMESRIDQWLERLGESQPERARELRRLRESNPDQFMAEMRDEFGRQREGLGRGQGPERDMRGRGRGPGDEERGRGFRERARWHFERDQERYFEWLDENYPAEAERLRNLREKSPDDYFEEYRKSRKEYGGIMDMERRNPELAEVLMEDIKLQQERDALLKNLKTAGEEEKEQINAELRDIVERRFDLILQKKELRYKELLERLERLKNAVEKQKAQLEELNEQKQKNIEKRMKELLGQTESLDWD